jgi:hypothetical protein
VTRPSRDAPTPVMIPIATTAACYGKKRSTFNATGKVKAQRLSHLGDPGTQFVKVKKK